MLPDAPLLSKMGPESGAGWQPGSCEEQSVTVWKSREKVWKARMGKLFYAGMSMSQAPDVSGTFAGQSGYEGFPDKWVYYDEDDCYGAGIYCVLRQPRQIR